MLKRVREPVASKIMVILWSIWRERNGRFWRNTIRQQSIVVDRGLEFLFDWMEARKASAEQVSSSKSIRCLKWHPPPDSFVKCNCDAAIFPGNGMIGVGMVLRDATGELLTCKMMQIPGTPAVKEYEALALALYEAITWVSVSGYERVIYETDAQVVVQAIKNSMADTTEFGSIIQNCKTLLYSKPMSKVMFTRRDANGVAHVLARQSLSCVNPTINTSAPVRLGEALSFTCTEVMH
ncbi:hypothetical protein PTKIN_Ptkin18bG0104100 [Pterospermum kingtungense]